MQTQYQSRVENCASSELGKAIISRGRIPELEAKLFNDEDAKIEEYERLEAELEHAEKRLKKLALENMTGLKGLFYDVLDKLGIYPIEKLLEKRGRELLAMKSRLEVLVKSYERERERLDEEFRDAKEKFRLARNLLYDYDMLLRDLEQEAERMKKDYFALGRKQGNENNGQNADLHDDVDIIQLKYDLEDQIAKIQSDIETYTEKKERVCAKIREYGEALKIYTERRDFLNGKRSKLFERINALKLLYERLKLIVKNDNTNLRKAIKALEESEELLRRYKKIAEEGREIQLQVMHAINNVDTSISSIPSAKVKEYSRKRQSEMEAEAMKIIEEVDKLIGLTH